MMETDAAYFAGVLDCYAVSVRPNTIKLRGTASWRIVQILTDWLGGYYRKGKERNYEVWVIKFNNPEYYTALLSYRAKIELSEHTSS